jgi:ribosomal protein S3
MLTIGIKVEITTGKFKCTSQRGDIENIEGEEEEEEEEDENKLRLSETF